MRWLYVRLLAWHPASFRERFADEMLEIFDSATGAKAAAAFLADGLVSLLRQWMLRAEFRRCAAPAEPSLFGMLEPYQPRPFALLEGMVLSLAVLASGALAASYSGVVPQFATAPQKSHSVPLTANRNFVPDRSLSAAAAYRLPRPAIAYGGHSMKTHIRTVALALGMAAAPTPLVFGQGFEAASIKQAKPGDRRPSTMEFLPGGRFRAVNTSLVVILGTAYNVPWAIPETLRIKGVPDWVVTQH